MQIEAGKYYRTRGGQVFGPMVRDEEPTATYIWRLSHVMDGTSWDREGVWRRGWSGPFDLVAEVYVSDTPPDTPAATPSDDTIISFNLSELAREGKKWVSGSIGFWIGDKLHMAHYDVHMGGVEGRAWPSDVPNPWRDQRRLPAHAPEAKTLRDEFAMRLMDRDALMVGFKEEAEQLYRAADAMMEARKK